MMPYPTPLLRSATLWLLFSFAIFAGCDSFSGSSETEPEPASYMPLDVGYTWSYSHSTLPDASATVSEQVEIGTNTYYVIDTQLTGFPDTLRVTGDGKLWQLINSEERLLADFTWREGDNPEVDLGDPRPNFPDELSTTYAVTVERGMSVTTPAGTFDDALRLYYDLPDLADEEFSYTFAPNVGIIQSRRGLSGDTPVFQIRSATLDGNSIGADE